MEEKLKYAASEDQNSFIHPFNRDEVITDADDHNPSTQHRGFKPTEEPPIVTDGMRTHHAIKQLLAMPAKDTSDHRPFPFGSGLIHAIHGLRKFGLDKDQIVIRGGVRLCQHDTGSQYHNQQD